MVSERRGHRGGSGSGGDGNSPFPGGGKFPARGGVVVEKVPADVQDVYGLNGVFGGFPQNLSNEGGTLRLRKPSGAVVLEVTWNDHAPWPVAPDGTGHSLLLARPTYGEASPPARGAGATTRGPPP